VAKLNPFLSRRLRFAPKLAYAGLIGLFFWVAWRCYIPGQGFTYLLEFGDHQHARYLPELRAFNHYELPASYGYDGQFYAEIAIRPHLSDPVLARAVDSLPYRARRILFSWSAWVFGGGNPMRVANAYAVQSLAAWLLLSLLLLRWFPPAGWGNFFRWGCVLFSFGMCHSLRASLVDGPSLLLIAFGVALVEWRRPWMAAAVLGISGLARETNVLAGVALAPGENTTRAWIRSLLRAALVVAPILLWMWVLRRWLGSSGRGEGNFSAPFSGYVSKWCASMDGLRQAGSLRTTLGNLATLVALAVQVAFLALRRKWNDPWWRVGATFGALMAVLGTSVWAGFPPAAARVLLPMTLAFNILVPRGRRWWAVLLLGNLNLLASREVLILANQESYRLEGPGDLCMVEANGYRVGPVFDRRWYPPGHSLLEYWRWSDGPSSMAIRNPQPFALDADLSFRLRVRSARTITVLEGKRALWSGRVEPGGPGTEVDLPGLRLDPGDTLLTFSTPPPPGFMDGKTLGPVVFSVRSLVITLRGKLD
jgi:hypothetical protein